MKFAAIGKWIHVRPDKRVEINEGGVIKIPDNAQVEPTTGTVISMGDGPPGTDGLRGRFQVKVGDRVLFSAYGGVHFKIERVAYRCLEEGDIFAVLDEEEECPK